MTNPTTQKNKNRSRYPVALLAILLAIAAASPIPAATVTNTSDTGTGSLRWAIDNSAPGDTIEFDRSIWGSTIRLSSELAIDNTTLTIQALTAADMAISGEKRCRVFHTTDSSVTLKGLTIENGHDNACGAGICSFGNLTMRDCTVRNCVLDTRTSTNSSTECFGAGVLIQRIDDQTHVVENCTITSNLTVMGTGTIPAAYHSRGTGMWVGSLGHIVIRNSVFSNNVAICHDIPYARIEGVGVFVNRTSGTIQNCLFRNNVAATENTHAQTDEWTSGLHVQHNNSFNPDYCLTIRECRFTGNRTDTPSNGAGLGTVIRIYSLQGPLTLENALIDGNLGCPIYASANGDEARVKLHLRNLTVVSNTADRSLIRLSNAPERGTCFTHCTIASNTLPQGTNAVDVSQSDGDVYLEANVIANNVSGDAVELYGPFTTNGYNVIDSYDAVTTTILLNGPGDRVGINPMLGPLAYNGGPTLTMMPLPGSPLIDAIPSTATLIAWDQRCAPRPYENGSEIGACETGPAWNVRFQRDQTVAVTTDEPTWTAVWNYATGQWTASLETAVPAVLTYPLSVDDITGIYLYNLGAGSFHESIHNWHQLW